MKGYNFKISLIAGVCVGSILLMIFRLLSMPITGLILSFVVAGFVTSFLFLPEDKSDSKRKGSAGAAAAVIIGILVSAVFILYYMFYLKANLIPSASSDINSAIYIIAMLIITYLGGFILGNIGGAIGAIVGDTIDKISKK
ncbi:DUF5518 domain-containing protein [Methanobacterium paludis]|uniref:DUF5518 domain-containing protein n=1 Tax=Methanobacterium paludis (strain DSM 25820 / JCM 18151 / SWAN1) TaxID=868131 RepID=F6D7W2_METPW|nr:DUF5518 domain-containing protein [Methanobacterium paludis]AEG17800.1 hypothetical protein MSWAN_0768 [Methanobacterium paludis]